MTRYTIQTEDGKVHYMDAEIEERVKALEKAVIALLEASGGDASEISAGLQSSLDFEAALEEEKAKAQDAAGDGQQA